MFTVIIIIVKFSACACVGATWMCNSENVSNVENDSVVWNNRENT